MAEQMMDSCPVEDNRSLNAVHFSREAVLVTSAAQDIFADFSLASDRLEALRCDLKTCHEAMAEQKPALAGYHVASAVWRAVQAVKEHQTAIYLIDAVFDNYRNGRPLANTAELPTRQELYNSYEVCDEPMKLLPIKPDTAIDRFERTLGVIDLQSQRYLDTRACQDSTIGHLASVHTAAYAQLGAAEAAAKPRPVLPDKVEDYEAVVRFDNAHSVGRTLVAQYLADTKSNDIQAGCVNAARLSQPAFLRQVPLNLSEIFGEYETDPNEYNTHRLRAAAMAYSPSVTAAEADRLGAVRPSKCVGLVRLAPPAQHRQKVEAMFDLAAKKSAVVELRADGAYGKLDLMAGILGQYIAASTIYTVRRPQT